jgi:hypothetical protein
MPTIDKQLVSLGSTCPLAHIKVAVGRAPSPIDPMNDAAPLTFLKTSCAPTMDLGAVACGDNQPAESRAGDETGGTPRRETLPLRWDTIACEILFVFDSRVD